MNRLLHTDQGTKGLMVGLCQALTVEWDVSGNLERTIRSLEEAAQRGAEIAVTPECVLHGYAASTDKNYGKRMLDIAEPLDGPNITLLCETARRLQMDVIVGLAERGEGERIYNSAVLISREGEIVHVYRKIHCRPFESIHHSGIFVPGEEFYASDLKYGHHSYRIGTMICFDREIPESVRCLRSLGAEFIACPLATNTSDMSQLSFAANNETITQSRAAENEVFIAVVNHAGRFNGGSFIVGPRGELCHQMGPEPGVAVIRLPIEDVKKNFHGNPLGWMGWGYRRPEVYNKYFSSSIK
jgi:predicted amidohydrolase